MGRESDEVAVSWRGPAEQMSGLLLLLKTLWMPLRRGELSERDLETAAFTIFIYARMLVAQQRSTIT
jgi:hypothetical protein